MAAERPRSDWEQELQGCRWRRIQRRRNSEPEEGEARKQSVGAPEPAGAGVRLLDVSVGCDPTLRVSGARQAAANEGGQQRGPPWLGRRATGAAGSGRLSCRATPGARARACDLRSNYLMREPGRREAVSQR